jgi:hypothetical protein
MNKEIEYITESEENEMMAEQAEVYYDALSRIAEIVQTKDLNRTNWNKVKILTEKAGF